jgi:hypothetical protein
MTSVAVERRWKLPFGDQFGGLAAPVIEVVPAQQLAQDGLVQAAHLADADQPSRPQQ